jgi:hypothetical protein
LEDFRPHRSGGLAAAKEKQPTGSVLQKKSVAGRSRATLELWNPVLRVPEEESGCACDNTEANPVDLEKTTGLVAQVIVGHLA